LAVAVAVRSSAVISWAHANAELTLLDAIAEHGVVSAHHRTAGSVSRRPSSGATGLAIIRGAAAASGVTAHAIDAIGTVAMLAYFARIAEISFI